MNRPPFSKVADQRASTSHNTTSVHIQRPKPEPLRAAGLTSVHGKPLVSPIPSPAELHARRKSERLEIASSAVPVRNSTMGGKPYTCPELRTQPHHPGSRDAFSIPSRTGFKNPQPA